MDKATPLPTGTVPFLFAVFARAAGAIATAVPRQHTLRAAIDWSYDLLSEKEKILLRRRRVPACGTFAGGWTLEAAEQVCADPEE